MSLMWAMWPGWASGPGSGQHGQHLHRINTFRASAPPHFVLLLLDLYLLVLWDCICWLSTEYLLALIACWCLPRWSISRARLLSSALARLRLRGCRSWAHPSTAASPPHPPQPPLLGVATYSGTIGEPFVTNKGRNIQIMRGFIRFRKVCEVDVK